MADYCEIGKNILKALADIGMTQTELAKLSGVSRPVINRIMKGKVSPNAKTLGKIAKPLKKEPSELIQTSTSKGQNNIHGHNNHIKGNNNVVNNAADIEELQRENTLIKKDLEILKLRLERLEKEKR